MALRDCINNDEIRKLQKEHEANGGDWSKTRKSLPGVDPAALDAGFKDFILGKKSEKKKLTKAEEAELARLEAEERGKPKDPLA